MMHQASKSIFSIMCDLDLIAKPDLFMTLPHGPIVPCQSASKSVHSFSKYWVCKSGNRRINERTNEWKDIVTETLRTSCLYQPVSPGTGIKIIRFTSNRNKHRTMCDGRVWHHLLFLRCNRLHTMFQVQSSTTSPPTHTQTIN